MKELRKERNILRFASLKEEDFPADYKQLPTPNFIKIEKDVKQIFVSPAYPSRHIIPARSQVLLSPTNQKVLLTHQVYDKHRGFSSNNFCCRSCHVTS
jgi:hypothetical protein